MRKYLIMAAMALALGFLLGGCGSYGELKQGLMRSKNPFDTGVGNQNPLDGTRDTPKGQSGNPFDTQNPNSNPYNAANQDRNPYDPDNYGKNQGDVDFSGNLFHICTCLVLNTGNIVTPTTTYATCAPDIWSAAANSITECEAWLYGGTAVCGACVCIPSSPC